MRMIKGVFLALVGCVPVVGHTATYPAAEFNCGGQYVVTWYHKFGIVALNGTKMDNFSIQSNTNTWTLFFAEYAAAGGSRTQYELRTRAKDGRPAIRHQWLNAGGEPNSAAKVVYCSPMQEVQAAAPAPSMLDRLADDSEG